MGTKATRTKLQENESKKIVISEQCISELLLKKKKEVNRNVSTFSYMHENDVFIKKHENENFKLKRKT